MSACLYLFMVDRTEFLFLSDRQRTQLLSHSTATSTSWFFLLHTICNGLIDSSAFLVPGSKIRWLWFLFPQPISKDACASSLRKYDLFTKKPLRHYTTNKSNVSMMTPVAAMQVSVCIAKL